MKCERCGKEQEKLHEICGVTNTHGDGTECEKINQEFLCDGCYEKQKKEWNKEYR